MPYSFHPGTYKSRRELTWLDCAALIIGIMLGTGIFVVFPTLVAAQNPSVLFIVCAWLLGTLVALFGAMVFAELASVFPQSGGDYVFLRETYAHRGKAPVSFLFAWAQILVIRPASLVSLAIVLGVNCHVLFVRFGEYFYHAPLAGKPSHLLQSLVTMGSLMLFTFFAMRGVRTSKWVQNSLTFLKLACLATLIAVGLYLGRAMGGNLAPLSVPVDWSLLKSLKHLGMALVPIMWVFGGWNEAPYIAGEMKNPSRSIPLALTVGLLGLGSLYVLINFVYILHLTPAGLAGSWTFASDLMGRWFGTGGEVVMASILVLSTAGAINGLTLTGGRMTHAFSLDFSLFKPFSKTHPHHGAPVTALGFNLALSLLIAALVQCKADNIDKLLTFTAGVVWVFFALVVGSLFIMRRRTHKDLIPFKSPLYPFTPIAFLAMCGFMLWGAYSYRPLETLLGIAVLLLGIPAYFFSNRLLPLLRKPKV